MKRTYMIERNGARLTNQGLWATDYSRSLVLDNIQDAEELAIEYKATIVVIDNA